MKNRRKLSIFAVIFIVAACIGLASCSDSNSVVAYDIPEKLWGDYEAGIETLKISRHEILYNDKPLEKFILEISTGGYGQITNFTPGSSSDSSYSCTIEVSAGGMSERFHITATLSGRTLTLSIPEIEPIPATFTKISE